MDSIRNKKVAMFIISQNLSIFGSSVVGFAILWYITLETSSGIWMMLATICSLAPHVLVSLFGGVLADRCNRKHLIMLADGFIALATLLLAVSFLLGFRSLELILCASAVRSLGAGIQNPAVGAIYPQLVTEDRLTKIQGINQTIGSGLALVSPAVGGMLLGTVGIVGAFFVDTVTAAVAILVMSRIRIGPPPDATARGSVWKDTFAGISYIFGHSGIRRLIICTAFAFLFATPAFVLTPLMIERTFGNEVWRLTVHEIVWSAAMICGGVFVSVKGKFRDKPRTMAACIVGLGVALGLMGASWDFASFLVFLGAAGFFWPVFSAAQTVFVQETVPPDILGRVFSVIQISMTGVTLVAILLYGPLADALRVETIMIVGSALLALVGATYGCCERRDAGRKRKNM